MKNGNYNKTSAPILAILALIVFCSAAITAAPGDLDQSFGNGGIVVTFLSGSNVHTNYAFAMAIQSDGKIVAVGEGENFTNNDPWGFSVVRYNKNGSLDTSFGGTGIVLTRVGLSFSGARSVAIQNDGRIVVAGRTCAGSGNFCSVPDSFAVVRYNPNGSLDTSFNGTGKVITAVGKGFANSVAIQTDGKITAAGIANGGFAVVRYNIDGSLDTAFGGTGIVMTPVGNSESYANSVAIQADGKIVAAGYSRNDGTGSSFAVVRYRTNGTLDTSFHGTGKVITSFGNGFSGASGLAIQYDGKIVVAGNSDRYPNSKFAIARYNTNGILDTSFGDAGKVVIPVGNICDFANSVAIQPGDGKIVAAGKSFTGTDSAFAVVRLTPNGSLDTTFNLTGKVITFSPGNNASAVGIQDDGKIVAAGGYDADESSFVLVRYLGGPVTGKIAFTSDRDGYYSQIYVMNNDGTQQTRLTNNNDTDSLPAFSPDGRKIAFVSQPSVFPLPSTIKIMNADGSNQTVLTPITVSHLSQYPWSINTSLSWSPDGSKIAFDDEGEIFTINVDGTNRTNLTNNHATDIGPAWSPDGSRILFSSSRAGYSTMHIMNADGSDVKVLPSDGYFWDVSPDWSPNGNYIVFLLRSEDFQPIICTANADGTNRKIFDGFGFGNGARNKPKWSPDGTKIVFDNWHYLSGDCQIYLKSVSGDVITRLTNTIGHNYQPSWQPRRPRASTIRVGTKAPM